MVALATLQNKRVNTSKNIKRAGIVCYVLGVSLFDTTTIESSVFNSLLERMTTMAKYLKRW